MRGVPDRRTTETPSTHRRDFYNPPSTVPSLVRASDPPRLAGPGAPALRNERGALPLRKKVQREFAIGSVLQQCVVSEVGSRRRFPAPGMCCATVARHQRVSEEHFKKCLAVSGVSQTDATRYSTERGVRAAATNREGTKPCPYRIIPYSALPGSVGLGAERVRGAGVARRQVFALGRGGQPRALHHVGNAHARQCPSRTMSTGLPTSNIVLYEPANNLALFLTDFDRFGVQDLECD